MTLDATRICVLQYNRKILNQAERSHTGALFFRPKKGTKSEMNIKIEYVKPEELIPYDNNPRRNEEAVEKVMNSIKEFGFKVPVIAENRENMVIVAGDTRRKAAIKLKLTKVPCIFADDLTPEQIKAFRLADNKTAEFARWDFDKLSAELEALNIDMEQFGFPDIDGSIDVSDEDFLQDTEIVRKREKTVICPHCGKEFEI